MFGVIDVNLLVQPGHCSIKVDCSKSPSDLLHCCYLQQCVVLDCTIAASYIVGLIAVPNDSFTKWSRDCLITPCCSCHLWPWFPLWMLQCWTISECVHWYILVQTAKVIAVGVHDDLHPKYISLIFCHPSFDSHVSTNWSYALLLGSLVQLPEMKWNPIKW